MPDNGAALATLREAMARAQHREGVPMVVALVDERAPIPATVDAAARADGAALAARVREIHRELAPTMRDDDNGGVISALVIAAYERCRGSRVHG